MSAREGILVTVSGPDRAGITVQLMEIVVKSHYKILDMGQSVTHGLLSLSILIGNHGEGEQGASPILKDLLFATKKMGMSLNFEIIQLDSMSPITGHKFILVCSDRKSIAATFMRDISQLLANSQINILRIDNAHTGSHFKSLEITTVVPPHIDWLAAKGSLLQIGQAHQTDIAFFREEIYRCSKRLIVFDMDSTLIQGEVIDEMAKVHGVAAEVTRVTAEAMNGRIDFATSLRQRLALLQGFAVSQVPEILQALPLTPGAREFIATVKGRGYKVALISGGFMAFALALKDQLGLDYAFANTWEEKAGQLTGQLLGPVVDASRKAVLLEQIAKEEGATLEQVVAIGDGANDLPMLAKAGMGIAFHAKRVVRERAENQLSYGSMGVLLHFLGIS